MTGSRSETLKHIRYVATDNPVTLGAFVLFTGFLVMALCGPWIAPYDALATDTAVALQPPSAAHWFGTDQLGRDILSRIVVAARLDFGIAISAVLLSFLIGATLGCLAGFYGGWTDTIVGRVSDTIMAFPLFVLAMGIVAALGNTIANIVLATAIINLPFNSCCDAEVNIRRNAGYVEAARLSGNWMRGCWRCTCFNICRRDGADSLNMGWAILNAAGLSFIGSMRWPPQAEGASVAEGATQHHFRRMVDRAVSRRCADAGAFRLLYDRSAAAALGLRLSLDPHPQR
jgi:peptide/nickel transport system permease protein